MSYRHRSMHPEGRRLLGSFPKVAAAEKDSEPEEELVAEDEEQLEPDEEEEA